MKKRPQRFLGILSLLFLFCFLLGGGMVTAAPLWSYPNDKVLISEVKIHGLPGSGAGTEWIEIFNPTLTDRGYDWIFFSGNGSFLAHVPTPLPPYPQNDYPPLGSGCFLYMAHDAGAFHAAYNQCPDYAGVADVTNCPNTQRMWWPMDNEIGDKNQMVCMDFGYVSDGISELDMVAWGTGLQSPWSCIATPVYPLTDELPAGETYLRGDNAPEWIGPGAEGEEYTGLPHTERLGEVWRTSDAVTVPWEGPEVGACRTPTAVTLATNATAQALQTNGYALTFFGLLGLLIFGTAYLFLRLQAAEKHPPTN